MSASLVLAALLQAAAPPPANPPAEPAAASPKVVTYPASYFAPFRPNTALDMLNRLPGFTLEGGGGQRGFAGGEGNVRIDGQLPAARGDNIEAILRRTPADSIERIDLITGGAQGIDMQGQSLIANIIRRKDSGLRTTVTAGGAVFKDGEVTPTFRLEVQKNRDGRLADGLLIYRHDLDGGEGVRIRGLADPAPSEYVNDIFFEGARVSGAYESPFASGKVRLNATIGQTDFDIERLDTPLNGGMASLEETDQIVQLYETGARYSRNLDGGSSLEASLYQSFNVNDVLSEFARGAATQTFESENLQAESIGRVIVRLPKRGAWSFDGGAEATFNALTTKNSFIVNGASLFLPNADVKVEELRGEVFATAVWTQGPRFNLQMGLRAEASNIASDGAVDLEKSLAYVKPRAIATWTPKPGHMAVLRLERSVDQLSFGDFSATASLTNGTVIVGNPNLLPAENLILEARYERRFGKAGALILSYVRRDIDHIVGRNLFVTPEGVFEAADNIGSGYRESIGLSGSLPLDAAGLEGGLIRGSYNAYSSELTDPITGERRPFSGLQPWDWGLTLSYDPPGTKWRGEIGASQIGPLVTYLSREIGRVEGGVYVTGAIEYKPTPKTTWRLEVLNLLDPETHDVRTIYSAPRNVGVVSTVDAKHTRGDNGGRGARLTLRRTL